MDVFDSSQGFVRALKASHDPPRHGGPTKLEIARKGWDDAEFYLPNKAEVIIEWILSKFLKEKGKQPDSNPLLRKEYWTLLHDVISDPKQPARMLKTWLTPLLNRIPIVPILLAFLKLLDGSQDHTSLVLEASPCLRALWPGASQKSTTETLLEIFGAHLDALQQFHKSDGVNSIGPMLTASFRNSFYNSSNKRKIYASFSEHHLLSWLICITSLDSQEELYRSIYNVGTEILFNLDVLRQELTPSTNGHLFSQFSTKAPSDVFQALPPLLTSYVEALRKHRGALFSQSSQTSNTSMSEVQARGMDFFGSCVSLLEKLQPVNIWEVQLALLRVVEKEQLFSAQNQSAPNLMMNQLIVRLLDQPHVAPGNENISRTRVEGLSTIVRIDFDLLDHSWHRVLTSILMASGRPPCYLELTGLILEHHAKTKTVDKYIDSVLYTIRDQTPLQFCTPQQMYHTCLSGPLFHQAYWDQLSRAVNAFVAGNQSMVICRSISGALAATWSQLEPLILAPFSSGEGRPTKKHKPTTPLEPSFPTITEVQLSLCLRTAEAVLPALPLQAMSPATREEVILNLQSLYAQISHAGKLCLKKLKNMSGTAAWSVSVVAVAILRLQYALNTSYLSPERSYQISNSLLLKTLSLEPLLPELRLELFRTLFADASSLNEEQIHTVLDSAAATSEAEDGSAGSYASWSGEAHALSDDEVGREIGTLGLAHMLFNRWLPDVEDLIRQEDLSRFVNSIFSTLGLPAATTSSATLDSSALAKQVLQNANFWESAIIRDIFVQYLRRSFAQASVPLDGARCVIQLLLNVPSDYLPRAIQLEAIKFALATDKGFSSISSPDNSMVEGLWATRLFLGRSLAQMSHADQLLELSIEDFVHILESEIPSAQNSNLSEATFKLIDRLWIYIFQRSNSKDDLVGLALDIYCGLNVENVQSGKRKMLAYSFSRMVKVVATEVSYSSRSARVCEQLHELYRTLSALVIQEISNQISHMGLIGPSFRAELYTLWHALLSLRKWGAFTDEAIPLFGQTLISRIFKAPLSELSQDPVLPSIFGILLEEVDHVAESQRLIQLEFILATYIRILHQISPNSVSEVNARLTGTLRSLSVPDFAHLSNYLLEFLTKSKSEPELIDAIRFTASLFKEHPPGKPFFDVYHLRGLISLFSGTLKQLQALLSQCLLTFMNRTIFVDDGSELRQQILGFISLQTTGHPAVLRHKDMGPIWTILVKVLSGSRIHEPQTSKAQFQSIITTIGALIRLRRDLVVNSLPLLGNALRLLILSLRSVRPHLGSKQTALVADTQPIWLSTHQPLGAEEAKAIARLLQSLATKTVVRSHTSSETQKAGSLEKAFSKHAIYVVKAFSDAMNDPLCVIPFDVRKELRPGLYSLLGMINEHDRDALMATALDAGGKSTIKALWKEYEKQRYIGKG